jgi:hypothetical protein
MQKHNSYIIIGILIISLSSCFKKDNILAPEKMPPSYKAISINEPFTMYTYNSYINLDSGFIVKKVQQTAWDLAFDCSPKGWQVLTNAVNSKEIARTGSQDFSQDYTNYNTSNWLFDASSGNPDSMAIDKWVSIDQTPYQYSHQVYLLGTGQSGKYTVSFKLQFISLTDSSVVFLAGKPEALIADTIVIKKDPLCRNVFYSFNSPDTTLKLEPPASSWDIMMGSYQTMLYTTEGIATPYIVRGVLSNTPGVEALVMMDANFWNFGLNDIMGKTFTPVPDAIGWNWKDLKSRDNALYRIVPDMYYVIKTKSGKYVKLLFLSYTNSNAQNGYPLFVVGKLQ